MGFGLCWMTLGSLVRYAGWEGLFSIFPLAMEMGLVGLEFKYYWSVIGR